MSAKSVVFRAGIIPYYIDPSDGSVEYMFMKPSDPTYGGEHWQIAKGRVEHDDPDNLTCALREGAEELGLLEDNILSVQELGVYLGRTIVYICEVKSKKDFAPFHFETGDVVWLTMEGFNNIGRPLHRKIVEEAESAVRALELYQQL